MKVREALKYLQELNEDDEIVIAWWEHTSFPSISKEDWNKHMGRIDHRHDWSHEHDAIQDHFDDLIKMEKED